MLRNVELLIIMTGVAWLLFQIGKPHFKAKIILLLILITFALFIAEQVLGEMQSIIDRINEQF